MWLNETDIRKEEPAKIGAPSLLMASDRDVIILEHSPELFRAIKGAQLCIIPGTTHFLVSEKPNATNRVILEFLFRIQKQGNRL